MPIWSPDSGCKWVAYAYRNALASDAREPDS
jgi:hypothetical protein